LALSARRIIAHPERPIGHLALGEPGDARRRRDPGFLRSRGAARDKKGKGDEAPRTPGA